MKNKFTKISLLATAASMMFTLVGCGGGVSDEKTIVLWSTFNDSYQAVINKAKKQFEEKYPEYRVKIIKQSGSYNDLKELVIKGVQVGDIPDLVAAYPDSVADFIMTGKALDITPWMTSTELDEHGEPIGWTSADFDDIASNYITEGQNYMIPGTYSLPICKSTEAMYYNRDILIGLDLSLYNDEINDGAPLDDEYIQNLTWDELLNVLCPAILEYNNALPEGSKILNPSSTYQNSWSLVGYDSDDNLFITLAEQYGLGYTSVNPNTGKGSVDFVEKDGNNSFKGVSDEYMEVIKMLSKAYQNKIFSTTGVIGKRANYVFTTGGMLFSIGSTGGVKYQFSTDNKVDVGVAPIPQADLDDAKVINQGPSIAFLKPDNPKDVQNDRAKASWLFYKEWTSTALNTEWSIATDYAPIRTSVAESELYLNHSSTEGKSPQTLDILKARNARYVGTVLDDLFSSPVFVGSSKARNAVGGIIADILKNCTLPLDPTAADYDAKMAEYEAGVTTYFRNGYNNAI